MVNDFISDSKKYGKSEGTNEFGKYQLVWWNIILCVACLNERFNLFGVWNQSSMRTSFRNSLNLVNQILTLITITNVAMFLRLDCKWKSGDSASTETSLRATFCEDMEQLIKPCLIKEKLAYPKNLVKHQLTSLKIQLRITTNSHAIIQNDFPLPSSNFSQY